MKIQYIYNGKDMAEGKELYADLMGHIASPPAQALREFVVAGNKKMALSILHSERVSDENAEVLYEYCRTKWLGEAVDLVEVPVESAAAEILRCAAQARAAGAEEPSYVVRYGREIKSVLVYEYGEHIVLYVPGLGPLPLSDVHQFWLQVPKGQAKSGGVK